MDVAMADPVESAAEPGGGFLRCFGRQMKLLREAAKLTQAELGLIVGYGEAQIAAVEQGRRIPKPEVVDAVDLAVGARGVLMAMKGEVERARYPSFFREFVRLEAEAVELHAYDSQVVNGLLQSEEYARAVFTMRRPLLDEDTVAQRVTARLDRPAEAPRPTTGAAVELRHRGVGRASATRRATSASRSA
ncbi:Scr1 family TA system antitoxin-like transcriptional regulator [Streptomyces sp. NPDC057249]|uniref:Scr1 family TA system antitoxin-like transcriptional regulator n=1 Tax=Streptomyces sp. NPDC057249 TaxID=3346067 RepID=UPI00362648FD